MLTKQGWSYQASNATFRALRQAGFNETMIPTLNDMILLTEPEAASHFTVRHLQQTNPKILKVSAATCSFVRSQLPRSRVDKISRSIGTDNGQVNEPFILVDAGGGTVVSLVLTHHTCTMELKVSIRM